MRYSDEELRRMKARRRELVTEYGDKGQHHPMGRMIGGLNPAAQELYALRGKIAGAESERRAPTPVLTPRPGSKGGYGLKFDIEYQGRRGKLGTDNFGRWYVIVGEGSEANVIASDFKTKGEAAKAFARLSGATREGATRHHATKRSRSQAKLVGDVASAYDFVDRLKHGTRTKKSPAQLQREIDEVLAKPVTASKETSVLPPSVRVARAGLESIREHGIKNLRYGLYRHAGDRMYQWGNFTGTPEHVITAVVPNAKNTASQETLIRALKWKR